MKFKALIQYCVPQHLLSRIIGKLANCRWPWFKNLLINWFIKKYNIDLKVAAEPNPKKYVSFNDFFTRALKPETRPLVKNSKAIISPIDGHISQIGTINDNQLIQAKGHNFNINSLLGSETATFNNGHFITLYLSPQDYHRVHMPLTGELTTMTHIPGKLFSVQPKIVQQIPNLYARNERVVNLFSTTIGPIAVILVGAMLVASIETVWEGIVTPICKNPKTWSYVDKNIKLTQGVELGRFQFGSTVILLFPPKTITWNQGLKPNNKVIMGQQLGEIL